MRSNNKLLKVSLLVLTIVIFVAYYLNNKESFARISDLSILQVFLIVVGQSLVITANTIILCIFVSFFQKRMHFSDAARVTAYSSLINFFGFLQGGVGFRGIYLKKYFDIQLKKYFLLTIVQYLLLFALAALLIFIGISLTNSIQQALIIAISGAILASFVFLAIRLFGNNLQTKLVDRLQGISFILHSKKILLLACIILLQLMGGILAYGVALGSIGANVTAGGLLIFTGVSQFSIVIALTPGALGIREGLLLIAQNQMHLTTSDIIVASTIDRIVYFITLALLLPIALGARNAVRRPNKDQ